jgi:hypothetical protein
MAECEGLSEEKIQELRDALESLEEWQLERVRELNREVRNLKKRGATLSTLGEETTEEGTKTALEILSTVGAPVL